MVKKLICAILVLCLMLSCVPFAVMADGVSEEPGCSHHVHDASCTGASGTCTYVCETCVAEVTALVSQLPGMYEINADNKASVIAQLEAIDRVKLGLSDAARALVNWKKYDDAAFVCNIPEGWTGLEIVKIDQENVALTADPVFRFLDAAGAPAPILLGGNQVSAISITPNVETKYVYIPAGTYTVEETVEGEWHMSLAVNGAAQEGVSFSCQAGGMYDINIINTLIPETLNIPVTVTWNDANNQDGIRPGSVAVKLLADGVEYGSQDVSANTDGNGSYTFSDCPIYNNGVKANYSLSVGNVEGYTAAITGSADEGFTVTMTHTPAKRNVDVTVRWDDYDNQDGKRPASVIVNLYKNDTMVNSAPVYADTNWTHTFENLDTYENGQEISYTVAQEPVNGYTVKVSDFSITNTHNPETTSVSVNIVWDDAGDRDGLRPDQLDIKLLMDGVVISKKSVKKAEDGSWPEVTFPNLPKYADGKERTYSINAQEVEGYTAVYDGTNVTMTRVPETTSVAGTVTWNDNDNQDGKRPASVTVELLADGTQTATATVTADDNWRYSFTNLPKYKAGKQIAYTTAVQQVEGYTVHVDGENITITPVADTDVTPPTTEATTPPTTEATTPPTTDAATPPAKDETNPATGDASNLLLHLVMLSVSAVMLTADTALRIRKRKIEK